MVTKVLAEITKVTKIIISKANDSTNGEVIVKVHIFVKVNTYINGVAQHYIYLGKGDVIEYEGEKLTVKMKLENEIPRGLYTDFIKKV